jgi:hypothetical protein
MLNIFEKVFNKRLIDSDCIGDTGIHMSTSAPLETFLNLGLYENYDYWYINIYTLIRNFVECIEGNTAEKVKLFKMHQFSKIIEELSNDINVMLEHIGDKINVFFYRPSYSLIEKRLDNFRSINEFKSIKYQLLKYQKQLSKSLEANIKASIVDTNHRLPKNDNVIITTHIPNDLLNFLYNKNIILLESYTGAIKKKSEWYTKYHKLGKKDMSVFPFLEELYWILGDNIFIKPYPVKVRERLYEVALKKNWNTSTGRNKVIYDLRYNYKELYDKIKSIKRMY